MKSVALQILNVESIVDVHAPRNTDKAWKLLDPGRDVVSHLGVIDPKTSDYDDTVEWNW